MAFFEGFAKGIATPGFNGRGAARATTASLIYGKLYFHWPEIEQLESVSHLYRFLVRNGVTEQVLGDRKRLEKICERIGLSLRSRGRPSLSGKSDTATR